MRASVAYVEAQFDRFNEQIFGGRLPRIPVVLGDAAKYLGKCEFKVKRLPDGRKVCSDFLMRINTRIDLPESTVQDVIIHEMIHYFIGYHQLEDSSSHGNIFRALMHSINAAHGRSVSVTTKLNPAQRAEANSVRKWHMVAVVTAPDGKIAVKVLPRVVQTILKFYHTALLSPQIAKIDLYLTDNPYFNSFPASAALKLYLVDPGTLAEALDGATRYIVNGAALLKSK